MSTEDGSTNAGKDAPSTNKTLTSTGTKGGSVDQFAENKIESQSLSQSKNRAQFTATTAMSVVHVALLKEALIAGPEHSRFYYGVLPLIGICLALQVIAGLISIYLSHLQKYSQKSKEQPCTDICDHLWCCRLAWREEEDEDEEAVIGEPATLSVIHKHKPKKKKETGCNCCPFYFTTDKMDDVDIKYLKECEEFSEVKSHMELNNAAAELKIDMLKRTTFRLKKTLEELQSASEVNEEAIKKAQADLSAAKLAKQSMEEETLNWKVVKAQSAIISKRVEDLREGHVLKVSHFWQRVLNYVLYVVFILNTFITGLGITTTTNYPYAANTTMTATTTTTTVATVTQ